MVRIVTPRDAAFPDYDVLGSMKEGVKFGQQMMRQPTLNTQADAKFAQRQQMNNQLIEQRAAAALRQPTLNEQADARFASLQLAARNKARLDVQQIQEQEKAVQDAENLSADIKAGVPANVLMKNLIC